MPEEVITADTGRVVVGEEEDVGVTATVEEGTVPEDQHLSLTLKACLKAEADFPTVDEETSKNEPVESKGSKVNTATKPSIPVHKVVFYDKVSSFYVVEKNDVQMKNSIVVTVWHSAVVDNDEDYNRTFVFHFHRQNLSHLKFVSEKTGYFIVTEDGEKFGKVNVTNDDLLKALFVRIVRKLEELVPVSPASTSQQWTSSTTATVPGPDPVPREKSLTKCKLLNSNNRSLITA